MTASSIGLRIGRLDRREARCRALDRPAAGEAREAGRGAAYAALAGAILVLAGETLGIAHGLARIFGR